MSIVYAVMKDCSVTYVLEDIYEDKEDAEEKLDQLNKDYPNRNHYIEDKKVIKSSKERIKVRLCSHVYNWGAFPSADEARRVARMVFKEENVPHLFIKRTLDDITIEILNRSDFIEN